ncbi:hypothetical protein ACJX0J_020607, partial [Zea mays]
SLITMHHLTLNAILRLGLRLKDTHLQQERRSDDDGDGVKKSKKPKNKRKSAIKEKRDRG